MSTLYISWSTIRTYEQCKQRGMLTRAHKRADLADQRIYFPGTVTDRVVRDWLMGDPYKNPGMMPDMVESFIDREKSTIEEAGGKMRWKDKGDRDKVLADCVEAVTKLEPVLNQKVLPFEYDADFHFKLPLLVPAPYGEEIVVLNGVMDIIVRDGDNWDIWDVKQTRDGQYWRKTVGQITFYVLCREMLFEGQSRDSGLLQPLCPEEIKSYIPDENLKAQMMSRIATMAWDVLIEDFEPRADSKMCSFCDVKHACSKWQPRTNAKGKKVLSFGTPSV